MRGERVIDAGSRFAGANDPAGVRGRLLPGGSAADLVLAPSSDGSGASALGRTTPVRALAALALLAAIGVIAAVLASPAHAAFIHKPAGTFDLSSGQAAKAAVDEQTGDIYVLPRFSGQIEKFDAEGNPSNFTGLQGPNESQRVRFEGGWFTGDTFTLTCPNSETTSAIEWNSEASIIQAKIKAALEAKCGGTFSLTGFSSFEPLVRFEGTFAHTDVPQMTCVKVTGSGTCNVNTEANGAAATNKLNAACNQGCYQITVDNTGGPNQGVIYVSSAESMTTCCPGGQSVPNPSGGIHAYLPSGELTHSKYKGIPVDPHPFEFEGEFPEEPLGGGGLYTRSQETFGVHACGVAVDENGDLIIAHGDSNQEFAYIDKLGILQWATNDDQEGTLLGTLNSDTSNPCLLQVDSSGNVYYQVGAGFGGGELQFSSGPVKKYSPNFHAPSGTAQIPPELKDPSTLVHAGPDVSFAFDSEDNLYGLRPSGPARVQKVDQSGSVTETFGSEEFLQPGDVVVNKATGTVYVTDGSFEAGTKDVHVFKAFTVPNSITEQFAATTQTSGVLNGEVDLAETGEEVTSCEFEYTTEALYVAKEFGEATKIPCDEGTTFTANESVSTETSGLTLEEPYMFRLVTENSSGASNGTVHKFVPHAVIDLTTKPATSVAPRSATLNGSFNGNGDGTEYFFEYGHGPAGVYTATTPTFDAGEPNGATPLSAPISNLLLETTYHFRVVAVNGTGTSKGFDQSFTTPSAVAGVTTEAASDIGQETITLNGKFTGDGHDTKYFFEYGPTKAYGLESDKFDAGSTFGTTLIPAEISSYYGYTTYHYRVVTENEFGTTYGKDVTFSTEPAPKPIVTETGIDELTPTTAKVSAMVAPNRWDASWLFEWGETASYGTFTESEPILAGITTGFFPINTTIEGLEPATLYHFRAVAFNFTGVTTGPDLTFRTPAKPSVESATSSAVGQTTAHLSARVIPNSSPTTVHFEFGPTTGYGSSTASSAIGSETLARESAIDLTGLTPGTTYHYRAVGTNEFGVTAGSDQTFTTLPGPQPPPPPTTENKKCAKGKVKKHGKCVPKHKKNKNKKSKRHG
jgi:hypothetical protein